MEDWGEILGATRRSISEIPLEKRATFERRVCAAKIFTSTATVEAALRRRSTVALEVGYH
jgi:hypothetical protein